MGGVKPICIVRLDHSYNGVIPDYRRQQPGGEPPAPRLSDEIKDYVLLGKNGPLLFLLKRLEDFRLDLAETAGRDFPRIRAWAAFLILGCAILIIPFRLVVFVGGNDSTAPRGSCQDTR